LHLTVFVSNLGVISATDPLIAMRKSYGNTWWGQQFLNALQKIDFSNRLPRGKTYANKGAVKSIEIKGSKVSANVQGSRPRPYQQTIELEPFSEKDQKQIVQTLLDNPFLMSQLLNRELPPGVAKELDAENISLFPQSWRNVRAHCSCPDYAVPCKHLAAVFYLLANEVDQHPFLVFQLRGLDLIQALTQAGMTPTGALKANVPQAADLLQSKPEAAASTPIEDALATLDFSRIPDCREKLLKLLPEQTPFYPHGSFKQKLNRWYKDLSKVAKKWEPVTGQSGLPYDLEALRWELDDTLRWETLQLTAGGHGAQSLPAELSLSALIRQFNQEDNLHQAPELRLMEAIWRWTLKLMEQSALIPQVVQIDPETFHLRWLPAQVEPTVEAMRATLAAALPADAVQARDAQGKLRFLTRAEQLRALVANLVQWLLSQAGMGDPTDSPVEDLFFGEQRFEVISREQAETPYAIQQWLQRYYLSARELTPVLRIEEDEPDFWLSFAVEDTTQKLSPLVPLSDLFDQKDYADKRLGVMQDLALLEEYLPDVRQIVGSKGRERVRLGRQSFVRVLTDTLPAFELIGIRVLLPKALRKIIRPQAGLSLDSFEHPDASQGYLNLKEMLHFQWQVALGDQLMDAQAFLAQVKKLRGLVKIQDQYVLIDEKDMQALVKKLQSPPELDAKDLLQAALSETYQDSPVKLSAAANKIIQELVQQELIDPPQGLLATFRPYQHRGYSWLYKNHRIGFGSILADDMGLGKTLQVIALIARLEEEGALTERRALIVVPTPLLSNWQREFHKFAPAIRVGTYHGPQRELNPEGEQVILTSYGVARSDQKILSKHQWGLLIIDEAQAIKNPGTAQTKALKKIKADSRIAMSGTPVENRLSEYWSIFDFTNRGYLATLNRFKKEYIAPIELDRNQNRLQAFRQITSPFILRRVKTDKSIISDLPDKIEQNHYCTLTAEQTALYQGVVEENLQQIEENEGIARAGMIFKLMTALKQICNHPSLFLKQDNPDPDLSGKASLLLNLLGQIREQGEKVLIFTQYKTMGDLLTRLISTHFPEEPLFLHGGLTRKKRDHLVDTFQSQPYAWAFVLSLKAAGTGLNLTAANHVIHYDLWWNPAVEAQATDRAFRIGQQKNVQVSRFISQGTFEEKIDHMIQQKRELADLTVGSGEQWIGELSNQALKDVFRLVEGEA
jgi:uncharacterized Zn finger protein/superfamily II DNA or RNA helicase